MPAPRPDPHPRTQPNACDACLARTWLLARLAGHLDHHRGRLDEVMALSDGELIAALAGKRVAEIGVEYGAFDPVRARSEAAAAGLDQVCRCRPAYPAGLLELASPPAVLHVTGGPARLEAVLGELAVAVVGSREPSLYGADVARGLARGLAVAGLTVVSGLARGIDTCAHRGALELAGQTVAVLAGAAERPYPPRSRALHQAIVRDGVAVSEMPPGTSARRWMFPARNRLIAALSAMTVVVEARPESGALITAGAALALGRPVGAVPGRVGSPLARGPHQLLRDGARLIERAEDVVEILFGGGAAGSSPAGRSADDGLSPEQRVVLETLAEGHDTETALRRAGLVSRDGLAVLSSLELAGRLLRAPGGRYSVRS